MNSTAPRSRFWIKLLTGIPIVLLGAWGAAWFAASQLSTGQIKTWMAREQTLGRTWSCTEITTSGFPMSFTLTCANPALLATANSGPVSVNLSGLKASYSPLSPLSAKLQFRGPMQIESASGPKKLAGNWDQLAIALSKGLFTPPQASLAGQKISLQITTQSDDIHPVDLAKLAIDLIPANAGTNGETLKSIISAEGIFFPALNQAVGNSETAGLSANLDLQRFEFLKRGGMPARLEAWRGAKGALEISDLKMTKGRLALEATGTLRLDQLRRPEGTLNTRTAGLSSLLERFGLPNIAGPRGGILGGLLRKPGSQPAPAEEPAGRFIPLPLTLQDGFVRIGPLKTPIALRPIF